jgi:hypothetical protein
MNKIKISIIALSISMGVFLTTSCIGSFALTNQVYGWNKTVTNQKFVNELVFLLFCIVPVYEVSLFIDGILLNSIEFWTGNSPMANVDTTIKGNKGEYHVKSTVNGYDVELLSTGEKAQFLFDANSKTWSLSTNDQVLPLVQYNDKGVAHFFFDRTARPADTRFYAAK